VRNTNIEWCDDTWNPIRGCSVVSPGCANCYAMGVAARFAGKGQPYEGLARFSEKLRLPQWTGEMRPEYSSEDRAYGKALRERRERVGIYLGAAARALGISVVELSSAERGGGRIQPDDLIELAWSRAKEPDGE